jgi:lysophospholipase L1-like esterase
MSRVQNRVDRVVHSIHRINPDAHIYLLGLYDPYRGSTLERFLDEQIARWDAASIARFARRQHVDVIRIADLFPSRRRLSPLDGFHPSAAAYAFIASRIASSLE